jgi:hypothetical protein
VTPSGRQLILWEHLANSDEHEVLLCGSDEVHPTEPNAGVTASIVGGDDLIRRQRHPEAVRKEHERARRAVSDDPERRCPIDFAEDRRRRNEVDQQRGGVVHSAFQIDADAIQ